MTNKELQELLQEYPDDYLVQFTIITNQESTTWWYGSIICEFYDTTFKYVTAHTW